MAGMRHVVASDLKRCVDTFVEAYLDDPYYRWLLPLEGDEYREALGAWFARYVEKYQRFGHFYRSDDFKAATAWVPPDVPLNTPGGWEEGRQLLASLTNEDHAKKTYDSIAARQRSRPGGASWQLIYLAVAPSMRGGDHGRIALAHMVEMCDEQGFAIYCGSANDANAALLEPFAFRRLDQIQIPDGPTLQPMYRDARAD